MVRIALPAAIIAFAAAGCTTMASPPPQVIVGPCTTDTISWAIGNAATAEVVERARIESNSSHVRVIEPNQAVTQDYREDRLNMHVNELGAINSLTCG